MGVEFPCTDAPIADWILEVDITGSQIVIVLEHITTDSIRKKLPLMAFSLFPSSALLEFVRQTRSRRSVRHLPSTIHHAPTPLTDEATYLATMHSLIINHPGYSSSSDWLCGGS